MNTEIRLQIDRAVGFADGHEFAGSGAYERLVGTVSFALDPDDPTNGNIVDLDLAPRNGHGLVEFSGDLDILKPVDSSRGNQRLLYDVNNRGNRTALRAFNDAPADANPISLASAGNGFLMRNGYTVVWSGWQGDLVPGDGLLTADLPEALDDGKRVRGTVRQEFIADAEGVLSMPLSGATVIRSYETLDMDTAHAAMTMRERETDPRQPVQSGGWAFAEAIKNANGEVEKKPSASHCFIAGGFRPGWIYELTYDTEGSRVMGLGIASIRDLMVFLRDQPTDAEGVPNPLYGHADKVYCYGQSLSARVLRQFVYDGYNADADGRRVFDAVYPHVSGGGRLFANARFAQVGRFPRQHEEHQWPSERYPFAYSAVPDPYSEELDSVLKRPATDPLVVHTHTNTEYWLRHASLGHTDPRNGDDLAIPEGVRIYVLSSAQHSGLTPLGVELSGQAPNVMNNGPSLRAALSLLDGWATEGDAPPASRVPLRADGTLVDSSEALQAFPSVPGFPTPEAPSQLPRYDYGPEFDRGIVSEHPPKPIAGQTYSVFVPQVDSDGNDISGLRSPEIEAPVGTHTGWAIRKPGFAEGDLASLTGSFVPFARTRTEREAAGDPRLSIEERYGTHEDYVRAMGEAAQRLVSQRLLLQEDADRYVSAAQRRNPLDPSIPLRPLSFSAPQGD